MEVKEQILEDSKRLFMSVGIKSVSMDDIARQIGISKKTIYLHFDSKKDLVEEIFDEHIADEQSACERFFKRDGNAIQQMIDLSHYISQAHTDLKPTVMYDIQKYYPRQWRKFEQFSQNYVSRMVEENIVKGQKEGYYRKEVNPSIIKNLYIDLVNSIIKQLANGQGDFKSLHLQMVTYHLHGICTAKGITYLQEHINEI